MAFSGGTFSRTFDCTTDRDNGVKILASKFDTELDGFATGLSTCILKDGTQTCTAAIPFAEGLTVPDNKTIILGTNSDITIQYDESTNDSLEIAANVEGAALGIVLKADQGDDNADQHKLNIADGGVLTLGSKISGSFVSYLTHTPNSTVASSTTAVAGNLTVGGDLTLGSGAVISEAELEAIDGVTAGTVAASKAVIVDSNKDIASFRNVTLTGELDAGSLDISGDADIDGTLEADAMTLNGTAITATATLDTGISNNNVPKFTSGVADDDFLRVAGTAIEGRSASEVLSDIGAAPAAGSSNIVTTGALNSGSITSGFGSIDNGASAVTTTGVITGGTLEATADTSAGDNAAIGFTSAEGLILTGQGSTNDVTIKNDADADVLEIPTGTTNVTVVGNITAGGTVSGADALSNRNMIINGSMAVAQRSTSETGQGASSGYTTLDRFRHEMGGDATAGRFTISQNSVTDLSGFSKSLKIQCTTADTSTAASEGLLVQQRFEGQNLQRLMSTSTSTKAFTLSFYAKQNETRNIVVEIRTSQGTNRQICKLFAVTSSWARYEFTVPAQASGMTIDDDNSNELQLNFWLHGGSTFTGGTLDTSFAGSTNANRAVGVGSIFASTSNFIEITGVQLEVGDVATPFEHRLFGDELARCQRYYYKLKSSSSNNFFGYAMAANTTAMYLAVPFPVEMRSNPTSIDVTAGSNGNIGYWLGGAVTAFTSIGISESGPSMTTLVMQVSSGLSAEKMYGVLPNGSGSIGFNAEL